MWQEWWTEELQTVIWWRNLREIDHLEFLGVDGKIILKWIFKNWDWGMDWIDLAQDRDKWLAVVKMVMDSRVAQNAGNLLVR